MKTVYILKSFIIKDFKLDIRYPFFFLFKFFEIFIFVTIAYYSSKLIIKVPENGIDYDYFAYLLIGISFFSIFRTGLYTYTEELTRYIQTGNFEYLISLPLNEEWIVIFSGLWKQIIGTIRVFFYFMIGIVFYKAQVNSFNLFGLCFVYLISLICFSGLGLFSASLLIYFKRAEPINWMISQFCLITGGVLFPVTLLPDVFQKIGLLNPVTYSLNLFRQLMLNNTSIKIPNYELLCFCIISILIFITGIFCIRYSIKKGKESGLLAFY
ncbi:MAG: ABC transporter, permease protein [uncultured bacterium]|nr:MAG: ABC transporter, permease protein [uncultured bacterium]